LEQVRTRSLIDNSAIGAETSIPALLTTVVKVPKREIVAAMAACHAGSARTSCSTKSAWPPPFRIASAVARPASSNTSDNMTLAPAAANVVAIAAPMPRAPPVSSTTLFCMDIDISVSPQR